MTPLFNCQFLLEYNTVELIKHRLTRMLKVKYKRKNIAQTTFDRLSVNNYDMVDIGWIDFQSKTNKIK